MASVLGEFVDHLLAAPHHETTHPGFHAEVLLCLGPNLARVKNLLGCTAHEFSRGRDKISGNDHGSADRSWVPRDRFAVALEYRHFPGVILDGDALRAP